MTQQSKNAITEERIRRERRGKMDKTKLNFILESMQGVKQSEWEKLKHVIDAYFNNEATIQKNKILMARPEVITDLYKRLF